MEGGLWNPFGAREDVVDLTHSGRARPPKRGREAVLARIVVLTKEEAIEALGRAASNAGKTVQLVFKEPKGSVYKENVTRQYVRVKPANGKERVVEHLKKDASADSWDHISFRHVNQPAERIRAGLKSGRVVKPKDIDVTLQPVECLYCKTALAYAGRSTTSNHLTHLLITRTGRQSPSAITRQTDATTYRDAHPPCCERHAR